DPAPHERRPMTSGRASRPDGALARATITRRSEARNEQCATGYGSAALGDADNDADAATCFGARRPWLRGRIGWRGAYRVASVASPWPKTPACASAGSWRAAQELATSSRICIRVFDGRSPL